MVLDMTFERREELIRQDALEEGIERGREEGMISILVAMVKDGEITIENAAKRLDITEKEFQSLLVD